MQKGYKCLTMFLLLSLFIIAIPLDAVSEDNEKRQTSNVDSEKQQESNNNNLKSKKSAFTLSQPDEKEVKNKVKPLATDEKQGRVRIDDEYIASEQKSSFLERLTLKKLFGWVVSIVGFLFVIFLAFSAGFFEFLKRKSDN